MISCSGECVAADVISQVLAIAILFVVETLLSLSGMLLAWLAWLAWWCAEAPLDGAPAFAEELPLPLLRLCRSFSEGEMGLGELSTRKRKNNTHETSHILKMKTPSLEYDFKNILAPLVLDYVTLEKRFYYLHSHDN